MLLAYFDKQKNSSDEAELLNAFQTRLQISDTGEKVSTEIQDLLNNLSTLKLSKQDNQSNKQNNYFILSYNFYFIM